MSLFLVVSYVCVINPCLVPVWSVENWSWRNLFELNNTFFKTVNWLPGWPGESNTPCLQLSSSLKGNTECSHGPMRQNRPMWARTQPPGAAERGKVKDQLPSQLLIQGDKELSWTLGSGGRSCVPKASRRQLLKSIHSLKTTLLNISQNFFSFSLWKQVYSKY